MSVKRSRQLRKAMTRQEVRLWLELRQLRPQGLHFRRQAPLLGYYPDFACFKARLIVELDGGHHAEPDQMAYDHRRDTVFAHAGFRTLRFWNAEVDENLDGVLRAIMETSAQPHPAPAEPPSP